MTMITPSYLGETIEYSSLHACRSTLEDPTGPRDAVTVLGSEPPSLADTSSLARLAGSRRVAESISGRLGSVVSLLERRDGGRDPPRDQDWRGPDPAAPERSGHSPLRDHRSQLLDLSAGNARVWRLETWCAGRGGACRQRSGGQDHRRREDRRSCPDRGQRGRPRRRAAGSDCCRYSGENHSERPGRRPDAESRISVSGFVRPTSRNEQNHHRIATDVIKALKCL